MADLGAIGFDSGRGMDGVFYVPIMRLAAPLPQLTMTVSGTVVDESGAAAARTVRAYRRSDGELMAETTSDAGTGNYSLDCPDDEVQRVVLDADGSPLLNDLIDRVIPA